MLTVKKTATTQTNPFQAIEEKFKKENSSYIALSALLTGKKTLAQVQKVSL